MRTNRHIMALTCIQIFLPPTCFSVVTKSANILSGPDTKRLPIWGKITMTHSRFLILCEGCPAQQNLSLLICVNRKFALLYFFSLESTSSKNVSSINQEASRTGEVIVTDLLISIIISSAGPSFANYIPRNSQKRLWMDIPLTIGKKCDRIVSFMYIWTKDRFIKLSGCSHTMSVYHDFSC